MKTSIFCLLALCAIGCSKQAGDVMQTPITVKGSVQNATLPGGGVQQYWKAGIIFDKSVPISGTATVTWYFAAGAIHGNPSGRYSQTVNFSLDGSSNGSFVFTSWKVDNTMQADSVKVSFLQINEGRYTVTIQ